MPLRLLRAYRTLSARTAARLTRDRSGAILVTAGLLVTVFVGFAGFGTDVGLWYVTQRKAQNATDSAAIAGGFELIRLPVVEANADTAAMGDAQLNGYADGAGATVTPAMSADRRSMEVTLSTRAPLLFSKLFLSEGPIVNTRARALVVIPPLCVLALDPAASGALKIEGTSQVKAQGCLVQVNSSSPTAAQSTGTSSFAAGEICVTGGATGGSFSPAPYSGCAPLTDPLATLTPPSYGGCDHTNKVVGSGAQVLSPGVYCGGLSLTAHANVTFQPGTYVIKDGPFTMDAGSTAAGTGVGFYLTGANASITMAGTSSIDVAAPTSGPMAGLIFYQGPGAPAGAVNTLTGDSQSSYYGTMYFPNQDVLVTGSSASVVPPPYTMLVARRVAFSGGGSLTLGSNYSGTVPLPGDMKIPRPVLVE